MDTTPTAAPSPVEPTPEPTPAPRSKRKIGLIALGAVVIVGVGLAAAWLMTQKKPVATSDNSVKIALSNVTEAPDLAAQVQAGTLPKVQDRIPKTPGLLVPVQSTGKYGGTWHLVAKSKSDHSTFIRNIGYENLVRWNPGWTAITPNVAQSYDVSKDATTYTFHLRDGMKWSDGQPFTADDIMFWYNDVFLDKSLDPAPPSWLLSGGKPVTVTKVNATTVKFTFAKTNSQFLQNIAQVKGGEITGYPAHYLKQFLPKYNPAASDLVKAAGVKDYAALFVSKFGNIGTPDDQTRWQHPAVPTLNAWTLTNTYGKDAPVVATRNPYYWKIDTSGHQLPYINNLEIAISDDQNAITQMALAGKLDMQDRNVGNFNLSVTQTQPQLTAGQQAGGYHLFNTVYASMNTLLISFNLNDKDAALRKVFQDKNFRIGMSYAINRPKIITEVYSGHGEPWQGAPRKESPYYNKDLAKQYTEYDVAKANAYLDKAGLTKNAAGQRLRSDGQPLAFTLDWGDLKTLKLIQADWAAVGVTMTIGNTTDRTAYYAKKNANNADVMTWSGDGGFDVLQDPRWYFPFSNESNYAEAWAASFYAPSSPMAETPPADVKKQQDLYGQIITTVDKKQQDSLMKQILAISKDQFYAVGIALPADGFGIVKNNFHNVPATMPNAFTYPNPAPTNTSQYYID